jgi:5-methylcytosine-specific restriction endonuclease McrA
MKKLFFCLSMPLVFFLIGCYSNQVWNKPNSSQNDFARDRYTCLQQSQQASSVGYVIPNAVLGGYQGYSSSGVSTNDSLFNACMNANGWYLQSKESTYKQPDMIVPAQPINFVPDKERRNYCLKLPENKGATGAYDYEKLNKCIEQ